MSTNILVNTSSPIKQKRSNNWLYGFRLLGQFLLLTILFILAMITAIPVVLLFIITSVSTLMALLLVIIDLGMLVVFFRLERTALSVVGLFVGLIIISGMAIYMSQIFATTPPITSPNGIASIEKVQLNDSEQWITIRGQDMNNPVLLFLAGGPGGSELVMTRRYLGQLEEYFTIVNWDQPGTGKSYNAVPINELTPQRYVNDAHQLTLYLRDRFNQEKVYVLGESWGSILGIWLVQDYPDLFHAFISTGQMVNTTENDRLGYQFAIDRLAEQGRMMDVGSLIKNGAPPYTGDGMAMKYMAYMGVLNSYMDQHAHGEGTGHNLMLDSLQASEYGLLDKVNWLRGLLDTFTQVYPQLEDLDFITQAPQLDVPIYFIKGRWDVNAMNSLTEDYFNSLDAPHKELIWFEHSAHTPSWDEPEHFVDVMVNTVLAQTMTTQ